MNTVRAVGAGLALLLVAMALRTWGLRPLRLPAAPTMAPALPGGALAVLLPSAEPGPGDVVVVRPPGEDRGLVVRLVARGPAQVALEDGVLVIDGQPAGDRRAGAAGGRRYCVDGEGRHAPVTLRAGEWWGLADRRAGAEDSRSWGAFRLEWIRGVVVGLDGARPPGTWSDAPADAAAASVEIRCPS